MLFLNDIKEISIFIACPQCKHNSKKDWIAYNVESILDDIMILRKSRIYFRCLNCKHVTEVLDSNLVKFVHNEIMTKGDKYDKKMN